METTNHTCPYCGSKLNPPRTSQDTRNEISKQSPLVRKQFIDRMADKYGNEFSSDLQKVKDNPHYTLQAMAEKYHLTRERVRQICVKVFGDGWIKSKRNRRLEITKDTGCRRDPRQKIYMVKDPQSIVGYATKCEYDFVQQCRTKGFDISCPKDKHCDTVINGFNVDVKAPRSKYYSTNRSAPMYHSSITEYEFMNVDFIALLHDARKSWFIIPIKELPNSGAIYLNIERSTYPNAKNRYWEYENAWHLLECKQDIAI